MTSQYVAWLSIGVMVYRYMVLVTITSATRCRLSISRYG